jgi:hypothetical protein
MTKTLLLLPFAALLLTACQADNQPGNKAVEGNAAASNIGAEQAIRGQVDRLSAVAVLQSSKRPLGLAEGLKAYGNRTLEISMEGDLLAVNRLIYSEGVRFPELGTASAERSGRGIADVAQFIAACAEADGVPCRDPEAIAAAFIFMLRGWYVDVLLSNRPVTVRQRQRWVETAVHALLAGRAEW